MKNSRTIAKKNDQVNIMVNISPSRYFNFAACLFFFVFITVFSLANNKVQAQEPSKQQSPSNTKNQRKTAQLVNNDISTKLNLADENRNINPVLFKQQILELTRQQSSFSTEQQHFFNLLQGYYLTYSGQYDKAENHLKTILKSNANELIKFRANYTLVNISTSKKNWVHGLQYLAKNIKSLSTINNSEHYQNGLITTIIFYSQIKQYNLALSYIDKLTKQTLSEKNNCLLKQLSLEAKFNLKQLKITDSLIEEGLQICHNGDIKIATNIIRIYKAKLHLSKQKTNNALTLLLPYIEEVNNTHYPMLIAEMNNTISKAYWQQNDINNAKTYATKALQANKNLTNLLQGVDTYNLLYQIAKQQQNFQLAVEYHEIYARADKAHLEDEKAKHLAFQLAEHKELEQKNHIAFLNKKNSLLTAEQALIKANAENTRLIIIVLVLAISVLIFWGIRLLKAHKRIKELAEYDALTGVFNRGHFTQVADSAIQYCKNSEQALSIIMFDLDHFKKINDSYGHACGDWALKKTVAACKEISRQNDIFARLGGEEFCILLTCCDNQSAQVRAEAYRKAIADITTAESGFDFTITASFGITDANTSGFKLESLLADADSAAYAAKHAGRNQIIVFKPEVPQEEVVVLDDSRNPF